MAQCVPVSPQFTRFSKLFQRQVGRQTKPSTRFKPFQLYEALKVAIMDGIVSHHLQCAFFSPVCFNRLAKGKLLHDEVLISQKNV